MWDRLIRIYVNRKEHRARMLWRVLVQMGLLVIFSMPASLILTNLYTRNTDAGSATPVTRDRLMEFMINNPLPMFLYTVLTGLAMCLSVWIAIRVMDRNKVRNYGLDIDKRWWQDFGFGLLLGAVLISLVFGFEYAMGWITIDTVGAQDGNSSLWTGILLMAIIFTMVGFYEEFISRGYHLTNFSQGFRGLLGARASLVLAMVLSAVIFGFGHILNPEATITSSLNIMVVGVILLGVGYVLTGRLALPIGMHITWNFFQGAVFGFPVSGRAGDFTKLLTITQHGDPLWTGGNFGPEGGLISTIAVFIGAVCVMAWTRYKDGTVKFHSEITEYHP